MPARGEAGRVYLVGAGPGDPGLLTLRGAEVLRAAEVLLYDALAGEPIVALAPPRCERIFVGKRAGEHALAQTEIEALMIAKAREGRRVVRLKGGDPFVFGRGGEEAEALHAAGVAFEVVPGISSALAAPAYAGIPVTHRANNTSFTVLTGHEDPNKSASTIDWAKLAGPQRVLVMLMATANLREIARQLLAQGVPSRTPVAAIQDATRPTQRTAIATLATIADEVERCGISAPAVIVVGDVVRLREQVRWFDTGPLFGRRVLITRAGHQSEAFARALLARGAEPILAPAIAIEAPDDATAAARALEELPAHAWLVFTSQNGVDALFALLGSCDKDARAIGSVKVAAIGERTAERLRAQGVHADLVPGVFISEEIARALIARTQPGDRVMIYRAQEARDVLPQMLEDAGRRPTVVPAYKTVVAEDAAFGEKVARADVLTFTSASTVHAFCSLVGGDAGAAARGKSVACIGPVTAAAAREVGLTVDVVAQVYTTTGLLETLATHLAQRR
jgi:uroporphyrinogen III methyltransferase / synthase